MSATRTAGKIGTWLPTTALLIIALLVGANSAWTSAKEESVPGTLKGELSSAAKRIANLLKDRGENSIAVGQFRSPPRTKTNAGPAIEQALIEQLKKLGIEAKLDSNLAVDGDYALSPHGQTVVFINGKVTDRAMEEKDKFTQKVIQREDVAHLMQGNGYLPPNASEKERDDAFRNSLDHPRFKITHGDDLPDNTRIYAGKESSYGLEIEVDGKLRPIEPDKNGLPYTKISRGEEYLVQVVNDSDYDAAVMVTIDGLNSFTFSELRVEEEGERKGEPLYQMWLVPAHSKMPVQGWFKNNTRLDRFKVTEYAESAVAKTNNPLKGTDIGVITVSFAAAWPISAAKPHDEADDGSATKANSDATGFGRPVDVVVRPIIRNIGKLRASVSVRYSK